MIIISLILSFIFGALLMFLVFCLVAPVKEKKPNNNKVRFYVARDKNDELFIYIGKPFRYINQFYECQTGYLITSDSGFPHFGLNKDDYSNLKWEDEPVEVFVNTED